jgi:AcrR family transcriptional regulator
MTAARKTPAARRAELIEAAMRRFAIEGLEETSVAEIVAEAGVAQGTFYLYFESKADLVNSVVVQLSEQIVEGIERITDATPMCAVEKLGRMRDELLTVVSSDTDLIAFFHRPGNEAFHDRVSRDSVRMLVPALERVIEQGRAEGTFRISHADDAARFIAALQDVTDPFDIYAEPARLSHHTEALTEFVLRGLGCDETTVAREIARVRERA